MDSQVANHCVAPRRPHRRLPQLPVILVRILTHFEEKSSPESQGELDLVGAGGGVVEQIGAFAGRETARHFFVRIPQDFVRQ